MNSYFLPHGVAKTPPPFCGFGIGPSASAGYSRLKQECPNRGIGL